MSSEEGPHLNGHGPTRLYRAAQQHVIRQSNLHSRLSHKCDHTGGRCCDQGPYVGSSQVGLGEQGGKEFVGVVAAAGGDAGGGRAEAVAPVGVDVALCCALQPQPIAVLVSSATSVSQVDGI